jgi:hypothetical protein
MARWRYFRWRRGGVLQPGITRARNDTDKPEAIVLDASFPDSDFERWMVAWLHRAVHGHD